ncbi:hypothetical protein Q1695_003515 [Nippostrongylus brasiliensis]|nr:hypothetical protein Q1695_003515 [Nippostrongylus brasiliensis]
MKAFKSNPNRGCDAARNGLESAVRKVEGHTDCWIRNRYSASIGFTGSAGALLVALDTIRERRLLDNYDFNFIIRFDNCVEKTAVADAIDLITTKNVDVFFGPTCNAPAVSTGVISSVYNIPHYVWGFTTANELANAPRFPTVIIMPPNYYSLSLALLSVMDHFGWDEFAFIYSLAEDVERCPVYLTDLQKALYVQQQFTISYSNVWRNNTDSEMKSILSDLRNRARVIVVCSSSFAVKRKLFLHAYDMGMTTSDYAYILSDLGTSGYIAGTSLDTNKTIYAWEDQSSPPDGRDKDAYSAYLRTITLSDVSDDSHASTTYAEFGDDVLAKMKGAPFFCKSQCEKANGWKLSLLAYQLYDAFVMYATVANRTLSLGNSYRDGAYMLNHTAGVYKGLLSNITIAYDGSRVPEFSLSTMSGFHGEPVTAGRITFDTSGEDATYESQFTAAEEINIIWSGSPTPLSVPKCCGPGFMATYGGYVYGGIAVALLILIAVINIVIFSLRARVLERERQDALWRIPFITLRKVTNKQSSFVSNGTEVNSRTTEMRNETDRMCFFHYGKEALMALKHHAIIKYESAVNEEFRKMRQLEHDNLNRFFGISSDGGTTYSLWRYCSRGTLQDVITRGSLPMDDVFIESMLSDLISGITFIHDSFTKRHGRLSSQVCVVDDRWQVKISYFGLSYVKEMEHRTNEELLWTAPEIIRGEADPMGTQEGDVYSFAIIASELVTKKMAWDLDNRKEGAEEIVNQLRLPSMDPIRPDLDSNHQSEIPQSLLHLIRECWAEEPRHRHPMKRVKQLLSSIHKGKRRNLMDHVMNTLENYASSLEAEVAQRTVELVEEKKKSDILLYRMLPRQVADRLKMGQSIEPESYDNVTVFFSDVVSFTTLASRGTPMQVVTLLNELYTLFDNTIAKHDVYKVETIGDGYLCVSGLPSRNGLEHIKEICNLSLELIYALGGFRVPHLPLEKVNIRVGVHSGPVVAGVVGLTMPRYCLFGDTVNTASRMESNGKPASIHMSMDAHELLTSTHRGYRTESRGEVIIKGKGVMETYWLTGRDGGIDIRAPTTQAMETI